MSETSGFLEDANLKKNPFRVPEGYFEELNINLKSNLTNKKVKPIKRIPLYRRIPYLYPSIGIAASVFVAVGALTTYLLSLFNGGSGVDLCNLLDTDDMYMVLTSM